MSNAIYGAAYLANPDVVFAIDSGTVTQAAFLAAAGGEAVIDQLFHDLTAGYNFGFIGNTTQITNPGLNGGPADFSQRHGAAPAGGRSPL